MSPRRDYAALSYVELIDHADLLPSDHPDLPVLTALIDQARRACHHDPEDPLPGLYELLRQRHYEQARQEAERLLLRDEHRRRQRQETKPTPLARQLARLHNAALDARRTRSAKQALLVLRAAGIPV